MCSRQASNFETDLIFPIIEYAAKIANVEYGKDKATDVSLKVIADHVRSMTFMIGDGILPSNEGVAMYCAVSCAVLSVTLVCWVSTRCS